MGKRLARQSGKGKLRGWRSSLHLLEEDFSFEVNDDFLFEDGHYASPLEWPSLEEILRLIKRQASQG